MSSQELHFTVFCIENVAKHLNKNGKEVYKLLKEDSEILDSYIIPSYDTLHTQGKEYIVEDIVNYMREKRLVG
jgi:hypothetical protein